MDKLSFSMILTPLFEIKDPFIIYNLNKILHCPIDLTCFNSREHFKTTESNVNTKPSDTTIK